MAVGMVGKKIMSIREREDKLFEKWRKKYEESSFVIDGCPKPDIYQQERRKVVFVLKDGNLGWADTNDSPDDRVYNQRWELEFDPTLWWGKIAIWSHYLRNPSASWSDAEKIKDKNSIQEALSHHCIIQFKKTWGKGAVSNSELSEVAVKDRNEIIEQISIYSPDFIVACGNGEHLANTFRCNAENRKETNSGVGYWVVDLSGKKSHLIDYCHPSIRVGTKVKGLIAKGLASAVLEIENNA